MERWRSFGALLLDGKGPYWEYVVFWPYWLLRNMKKHGRTDGFFTTMGVIWLLVGTGAVVCICTAAIHPSWVTGLTALGMLALYFMPFLGTVGLLLWIAYITEEPEERYETEYDSTWKA